MKDGVGVRFLAGGRKRPRFIGTHSRRFADRGRMAEIENLLVGRRCAGTRAEVAGKVVPRGEGTAPGRAAGGRVSVRGCVLGDGHWGCIVGEFSRERALKTRKGGQVNRREHRERREPSAAKAQPKGIDHGLRGLHGWKGRPPSPRLWRAGPARPRLWRAGPPPPRLWRAGPARLCMPTQARGDARGRLRQRQACSLGSEQRLRGDPRSWGDSHRRRAAPGAPPIGAPGKGFVVRFGLPCPRNAK
jgi:hypothetical protein